MERSVALAPETLSYGPESLEALRAVEQFISSMVITYSNKINISDVATCEANVKRVKDVLPEFGSTKTETAAFQMIRDELEAANIHLEDLRASLAKQEDGIGEAKVSHHSSKKHLRKAVIVLALILEKQGESSTRASVTSELDVGKAEVGDRVKTAVPGEHL